uniref:Uncharacterized protein n=1 Tax=Odontella aurita TaxID=265563 RepID=A0A7S4M861_9STRA
MTSTIEVAATAVHAKRINGARLRGHKSDRVDGISAGRGHKLHRVDGISAGKRVFEPVPEKSMSSGEHQQHRAALLRGPMETGIASDPLVDPNFDEDSLEGLFAAEDAQMSLSRREDRPQQIRALEDVDYWRKRAGWFDDDESMMEYNKGVYDTYYSLDDEYSEDGSSSSSSGSSSRGGGMGKKNIAIALKVVGAVAAFGILLCICRAISRRRSEAAVASEKTKSLASDGEEGGRNGRSKSRSGTASSRSSSRHRRSSSRARSKSVSGGRSRSKSVDRRSGSGRSRSRSRRKAGDGDNYELMGDEEEGRSQRTSRTSRSRSRSGRTRSRSKARPSRNKEEMLV